jgi:hypothetical protein
VIKDRKTMMESELWFQRYPAERGLLGADRHQPDLGGAARPDFRITAGGAGVICEVKEFTTSSLHRSLQDHRLVKMSAHHQHGTVRNKILKAAKRQLRPYADREEALVVVLANPQNVEVGIYEPGDMIEAMYGDLGFTFSVDRGTGTGGAGRWSYLDGGVFGGGLHSYVSAVTVLHRQTHAAVAREQWLDENRYRWAGIESRKERMAAVWEACQDPGFEEAGRTPGEYFFTNTFSTLSAATGAAVPLPEGVFDGPRDAIWEANATTGCLELVAQTAV